MLCGLTALSQVQTWQLDKDFAPQITITGTSTLHDWEVTCSGVDGVPQTLVFDKSNPGIDNFGFKVPVGSMDGGRGASMNDKIYAAFKSSQNPYIVYQQTQRATIISGNEPASYSLSSQGVISLAGQKKDITVTGTAQLENDFLIFKGSHGLKMRDFEMEPPTAMFGQIKTNDDVVVHFEIRYKLNSND